ncbi:Aromatic peroxygenase [Fusarium albosuccineum]|uniref:Aromatic peroxygenase n=1 Tax=Fusarium albosuccineum TaxID=1237068 RepID=A0A8H4LBD3_9HYPO|nr:Aromatic peroxygenase [Fusarium albosuccineum]
MQSIVQATNDVYGMSLEFGAFLAVFGTVLTGNPVSTNPGYSIGGPSRFSQNILGGGGLIGTPTGLSGSHNKYESDVSATREDLYVSGNNFHLVLDRFVEYWNAIKEDTPAPEQYSALAPFHYKRFQDSEKTNSHFFYPPVAGILVSPASYSFPPQMMANHSEEYPEGYLSREVFTTFFGVEGDKPGNFKVKQGWERIPENWYKRPVGNEFSIPTYVVDILKHASKYPRLLNVGGNLGKPNTFAGVDLGDLTGGVFNSAMLLEGDNLECFVLQFLMATTPDFLGTTFSDLTKALAPLTDRVQQLLAGKLCPELQEINMKLFEKYPGFTESYGTYAGLSKGSIPDIIKGVTGILGGLTPGK